MKYGLIGNPLGHSFSPKIHPLLGGYDYALYPLDASELDGFLRRGDWKGLNVTIPYKQSVIPYCDELTEAAKAIGSVNTLLRREDGSILGHNTDYDGFSVLAARRGIDFAGKKVLIFGSGGTSHTVQYTVRHRGAREVVVISRGGENNYENIARHADADILVNTTPVGMFPHEDAALPISLEHFPHLCGVLDVICNPLRTKLVLAAADRGIPASGGLPMLVWQAKSAVEIFTGAPVSEKRTEEVYSILEKEVGNLVLIGMPGCGKSTVGALLAARTGREFVDTDGLIAARAGKSIPEIFAQDGEAAFRALEREVIAALGKKGGQVIATGGGAVLDARNELPLRQNGTVVHLTRDVALLAKEGRPLSVDLAKMERERAPFYRRLADHTVANDGTPEQTVDRILNAVSV